jgi:DNA-binding transcriptional LysR family regulator
MKSKYKQLEAERGQPMPLILQEAYAEHGNQTAVARALGVSQPTISQWLIRLGLAEKTILVPDESRYTLTEKARQYLHGAQQ